MPRWSLLQPRRCWDVPSAQGQPSIPRPEGRIDAFLQRQRTSRRGRPQAQAMSPRVGRPHAGGCQHKNVRGPFAPSWSPSSSAPRRSPPHNCPPLLVHSTCSGQAREKTDPPSVAPDFGRAEPAPVRHQGLRLRPAHETTPPVSGKRYDPIPPTQGSACCARKDSNARSHRAGTANWTRPTRHVVKAGPPSSTPPHVPSSADLHAHPTGTLDEVPRSCPALRYRLATAASRAARLHARTCRRATHRSETATTSAARASTSSSLPHVDRFCAFWANNCL